MSTRSGYAAPANRRRKPDIVDCGFLCDEPAVMPGKKSADRLRKEELPDYDYSFQGGTVEPKIAAAITATAKNT
jgi:hypothetical protein